MQLGSTSPFFHVGILVEDLDEAVSRFANALGIAFCGVTPVTVARHVEEDGAGGPAELRLTFSRQGPPYIELLEMQGEGIYGKGRGEGIHHVGLWVPECSVACDDLGAHGFRREALQYDDGGRLLVAYLRSGEGRGTRFELVDMSRRAPLEAWLREGAFDVQ